MNMSAGSPLISVIIPIYNVEKYLNRCIDSLLRQNFQDYELILVNDCSTDHSGAVAQEYAEKSPEKCRLVNHRTNEGLAAARNTGLRQSHGEWITFVDSDDWVSEDYLSGLYSTAVKNKADAVIGGVVFAYDNGRQKSANSCGRLKNGAADKEIIALCRSYACGRLFRRDLFVKSGILFPEDIRRSEDIGTIIPILTKAEHIAVFEKNAYFYYQRSTSLSHSNTDIDLSFYPATVDRMVELSDQGYETELEFRSIHELLYGMVYLMIVSNKSRKEFTAHVDSFNRKHPMWRKNPYLHELPKGKQLFIALSGRKLYNLLRILVMVKNGIRT